MPKRVTNKEKLIQVGLEVSVDELADMVSTLNVILKNRKKNVTVAGPALAGDPVAPKTRRSRKNTAEPAPAAIEVVSVDPVQAVNGIELEAAAADIEF